MAKPRAYSTHRILQVENGFIVECDGGFRGDVFDAHVFEAFDTMVEWLRKQTEAVQMEREAQEKTTENVSRPNPYLRNTEGFLVSKWNA